MLLFDPENRFEFLHLIISLLITYNRVDRFVHEVILVTGKVDSQLLCEYGFIAEVRGDFGLQHADERLKFAHIQFLTEIIYREHVTNFLVKHFYYILNS